MEAANLAGKAINISKTTSPHAFSYSFTSEYSVPHGQAVWLTLPEIFEVHKNALDCDLEITLEKELFDKISKYSDEMNKILICSSCSIFLGKSEQILVKKSVNEKCTRCWHKVEELENGICKRCINNMSGEGEVRRFF